MKNRKAAHILASSIAALLVATTLPTKAATLTWDNGAATGNWNTTDANFGGVWTNGNDALFGGRHQAVAKPTGLSRHLGSTDQIDRLVYGGYQSRGDFGLFTAHALLYFATVGFAEVSQRVGMVPDPAWVKVPAL